MKWELLILTVFLLLQTSRTEAFPVISGNVAGGYNNPRYQGTDPDGLVIGLRTLDGAVSNLPTANDGGLKSDEVTPVEQGTYPDETAGGLKQPDGNDDDLAKVKDNELINDLDDVSAAAEQEGYTPNLTPEQHAENNGVHNEVLSEENSDDADDEHDDNEVDDDDDDDDDDDVIVADEKGTRKKRDTNPKFKLNITFAKAENNKKGGRMWKKKIESNKDNSDETRNIEKPSPCLDDGEKCGEGGICNVTSPTEYQCDCKSGWVGTLCDTKLIPCQDNPCKNGGQCVSFDTFYHCECASGYIGILCDKKTDKPRGPCADENFCNGHGKCEDSATDSATCKCKKGWSGPQCEIGDPCASSPCKNGGTCAASPSEATKVDCKCASGYSGSLCADVRQKNGKEHEEDHKYDNTLCAHKTCKNGGTCQAQVDNTYTCSCPNGLKGAHCREVVAQTSPCHPNACAEGDFCIENTKAEYGYNCIGLKSRLRILALKGTTPSSQTKLTTLGIGLKEDGLFDPPLTSALVVCCILFLISVALTAVLCFNRWFPPSEKNPTGVNGKGHLSDGDTDVESGGTFNEDSEVTQPWFCPCFSKPSSRRTLGLDTKQPISSDHCLSMRPQDTAGVVEEKGLLEGIGDMNHQDSNNNSNVPSWSPINMAGPSSYAVSSNEKRFNADDTIMNEICLTDDESEVRSMFNY